MGNFELKIHIALSVLVMDWAFSDSADSRNFYFEAANGEIKDIPSILLNNGESWSPRDQFLLKETPLPWNLDNFLI